MSLESVALVVIASGTRAGDYLHASWPRSTPLPAAAETVSPLPITSVHRGVHRSGRLVGHEAEVHDTGTARVARRDPVHGRAHAGVGAAAGAVQHPDGHDRRALGHPVLGTAAVPAT